MRKPELETLRDALIHIEAVLAAIEPHCDDGGQSLELRAGRMLKGIKQRFEMSDDYGAQVFLLAAHSKIQHWLGACEAVRVLEQNKT